MKDHVLVFHEGAFVASCHIHDMRITYKDGAYVRYPHGSFGFPKINGPLWYRCHWKELQPINLADVPKELLAYCLLLD